MKKHLNIKKALMVSIIGMFASSVVSCSFESAVAADNIEGKWISQENISGFSHVYNGFFSNTYVSRKVAYDFHPDEDINAFTSDVSSFDGDYSIYLVDISHTSNWWTGASSSHEVGSMLIETGRFRADLEGGSDGRIRLTQGHYNFNWHWSSTSRDIEYDNLTGNHVTFDDLAIGESTYDKVDY